jgi:uncharacterized protein YlxW (UPF0749 family)
MTGAVPTSPPRQALAPKLLVDLAMDPRDPGYEAAAARRGGAPSNRWFDRPAVAFGCLVIGFTLAVAYAHTNRGAPEAAKVHNALVNRVRAADAQGASLAKSAQSLSNQLNSLRDDALSGSSALARSLNVAQLEAGAEAVTGPGLTITLKDPKATPSVAPNGSRANSISSNQVITDRDVRSVVNELWADGAEAIAVNGVRLTPTSAVRFAGDAVLVDFQPISSPYTVEAIGNADNLATNFAQSDVASRYQTLESVSHIGFSFDEHNSLKLPASPIVALRYAHVPSPTPSTSSSSGAH